MKFTVAIAFVAIFGTAWILNAVKLTGCDFDPNYRCEIIHLLGVVAPPLSIMTVWFDDDED